MNNDAYRQCLDKIYRLGRFGIKLELDTILNILKFLNSPQKNYHIVHVAGTNGKGSTATYIASILQKAGFKTGVYTSPHLVDFNERITVNGEQISNDEVVKAYEAVNAVDIGRRKATFFEIATAMAFYHFSQADCEWAVIETGMGGRFDATNVARPQVSVITNLSIEHTEYLGNTIKSLAYEKGGIIKSKIPVVTGVSQPSGIAELARIAKENSAPLFQFKKDFSIRKDTGKATYSYSGLHQKLNHLVKPLPGDHQKENLSIALAACEIIFEKNKGRDPRYTLTQDVVEKGLAIAKWPGRLERVMEKPLVIIDGAHNLKAAQVLGRYFETRLKDKDLTLVLGILDDKPFDKMLTCLVPHAKRVILTQAKIDRSLPAEALVKPVRATTKAPVEIIKDVAEAVRKTVETTDPGDAICIAGSLYVAGEARAALLSLEKRSNLI